jgi:hypothetical protein
VTRRWAPAIKDIQKALRDQIHAEYQEQAGIDPAGPNQMPSGMEGGNVFVAIGNAKGRTPDKPFVIQVLPPEDSEFTGEASHGVDADLGFRCRLTVRASDEKDALEGLTELVGLVVDGYCRDETLTSKCGGPGDPMFTLRNIAEGTGEFVQEIVVHLVRRNAS